MQVIAPVTTSQLLQKGQRPLLKFEIFYGCCWVDLTDLGGKNYLKSISISTAGAGMTPNPVAGSWSAVIFNKNGMFDPDETGYAPYNEYFRAGVKVKIQVGAKYGGVDCYWRRIYGFMEIPDFSIDKSEVSLSGFDNMQFLTDTKFRMPNNYWGTLAIFDSVATTQFGAELYDPPGGDAAEIGVGEADNVANWAVLTNGGTAITSEDDLGGFSDYEIKFVSDPVDVPETGTVWYDDVCAVVKGTEYYVTFKYARTAGDAWLYLRAWIGATLIGGSGFLKPAANGVFYTGSFSFTAPANGDLDLRLACRIKYGDAPTTWRVDNISIKSVTSKVIEKYQLPEACMGVHYVELDEGEGFVPVWPGRQKEGDEGWFYDSVLQQLYFAEGKIVEAGTVNLKIHYYTVQIPENVVADLLVRAGLYSNQAEALAAMIYTATGITIDKVWFKSGSTCLDAVRMLCERCNYRFYFNYGQRPVFKPAPTMTNLLIDGGLNIWTTATDLTYWTENLAGTSTVNREAAEKIEGDFSCRFDVDAINSEVAINQINIPLTPLERYKLIFWYMNSEALKYPKIQFRNTASNVWLQDDGTWGGWHEILLPNSTIWKKFELEFYAHAGYSSYHLYLVNWSAAASSIYFDKVSIWRVPISFLESHITGIRDYEDRNEIKNMVTIEGIEQALPEGAEETKPSKFKGEASEVASINKYGEHTMPIKNHLFQDQATIDAYCAIYLAAFKDPKWYTTFDTPFNPVPLEKGDVVTWRKKYEAGGTPIDQRGIIRDIQINDFTVSYTIEKVT